MREFSCLWYLKRSTKNGKKSGHCKSTKKLRKGKKEPDFKGNQVLFGGDYWTRTSDLLRVNSHMKLFLTVSGSF